MVLTVSMSLLHFVMYSVDILIGVFIHIPVNTSDMDIFKLISMEILIANNGAFFS